MKQSTKTTNRAFMHNNIPYRYCYEEGGMIEIEKDIYTGSYEIVPPNKEMKGSYNSKMTKMIMEEILQKLAEKFSFQFTIRNRYRDKEEYLASVMIDEKGAGDAYSHLKNLYNNVLQENCDIGHNNFAHTVYLTITTEAHTPEQALEIFAEADTWIKEIFYSLYGFQARAMTLEERLELLHDIYHPGAHNEEFGAKVDYDGKGFSIKSMQRMNMDTKDVIAPEYYDCKSRDYMRVGNFYVRTYFINSIPENISDSVLLDLASVSSNSVLSIHYEQVDEELGFQVAAKHVKDNTEVKNIPVRDTVQDRKEHRVRRQERAVRQNEEEYFYQSALNMFKRAKSQSHTLLQASFVITLFAESMEELERDSIANVTYDLSNQIKDKLARVLYNLKSVLGDLEQIKVSEKDKAALMLKDLDTYLQLVSVSMECGNIPTSWIVNSVLVNEAKQLATALEEKKSLVIQNREILGEVFSSGFFKIDADSKVSRIKKLTEYIESELCLSDAAWTEYILQVKNEATYINGLYVSLDKMIHEINGLCDSLGIEHPSTVYELLARYKLHSILNAKYPVLEEWFDNDTEEVCQVINDYEDHCARLTELCDLIAQHCETKIIESINIAENASRFLSIKEINRFSQIRDFNFEALQNYVDESKKEYAGIKKIYYEIHDGISDKVDSILEIPDRIYDINRCVQILKLLVREVLPGDRWFDTSEDAHFEEYIGLCIEKRKKYELLKNEVEEHWDKDVYKLD